ncbi:MAG: hypothetical protein ISR78_06135 [Spirochaetia bacterium]|nr:hypothetical protein [Spirochaetia bacterium]
MKNKWKPVDFNILCEEHSFTREEYELLVQRINEEREFASTDIFRACKKLPGKPRDALGRWL